jgi:peptidoglycan hydrolase CwlO-like protein
VLLSLPAVIAAVLPALSKLSPQQPIPSRPPTREPGSPDESNPLNSGAATKAVLEKNQKNIKKDIERLYNLASELKAEVEKTDAIAVLSVAMVRKAEEIEKLAKQIKDRAKG